jgi:hypothetical protein
MTTLWCTYAVEFYPAIKRGETYAPNMNDFQNNDAGWGCSSVAEYLPSSMLEVLSSSPSTEKYIYILRIIYIYNVLCISNTFTLLNVRSQAKMSTTE